MLMTKQHSELIWMAWSPDVGFLPQAASIDKGVCWEMVKKMKYSDRVKVIRVQVRLPPKKRIKGTMTC